MARPIWTGSLSFGLVNVPVGLYSATEDKTVHFNQFEAGTSDRIRQKRVNERTGDEVPYEQIVKGYDLGGGEYVVVTAEELESVEPGRSRTIEISDFVDLDDIDPIYFKAAYYLGPQGPGAEKPYALLRRAMRDTNRVGLATFVFRSKQHLVAVRPTADALALETMYYADEVRDPAEMGSLPDAEMEFSGRELDAAKMLVESMVADWQPEQYRDVYREQVLELIDRKARGETISVERPPEEKAPVVDLLAALERSVAAARERRQGGTAATGDAEDAGGVAAAEGDGAGGSRHRTKAQLLEEAAELDVPGRSKMSRDELEEAVAAASSRRRAS
jgi:DNA end-binding protein Ku